MRPHFPAPIFLPPFPCPHLPAPSIFLLDFLPAKFHLRTQDRPTALFATEVRLDDDPCVEVAAEKALYPGRPVEINFVLLTVRIFARRANFFMRLNRLAV
jgi:hypothetical protein